MNKKIVARVKKDTKYPSAELVENICFDEYTRALNTYDKIYDKVNIALAFSGVVLLVILGSFDYTILQIFFCTSNKLALLSMVVYMICSTVSCALIVYSTIQLLLLMKSRSMKVINALDLCNKRLYEKSVETVSLWISDKYVKAIETIRTETEKKQKSFNSSIWKTVIAIICYAIALIIQKGIE